MPKPKTLCRVPNCGCTDVHSRGICRRCYQAAYRLISRGKTSWGELVQLGFVEPHRKPRALSNPLVIALRSARGELR